MAAGDPALPSKSPAAPEVVLLLSGPQLWWAYLAVLSAPARHRMDDCRRVVYVDNFKALNESLYNGAEDTRHVLLFWDGVPPCNELPHDLSDVCKRLRVIALQVGPAQCETLPDVRPMYPDGALSFHAAQVRLTPKTFLRVSRAKLRNLLVPIKNVLRPGGSYAEAVQLLCGSPRVVFCGSFGLEGKVLGMLDNRYGRSPKAVRERTWVNQSQYRTADEYSAAFEQDLACLLQQYRQAALSPLYFVAAVRLLDRDYLLQHLRSERVPLYTNQFSTRFIDVYSTPSYRQHLFLDLGSTISAANYPRTADLAYYRKRSARVDLPSDAASIANSIEDGSHLRFLESARTNLLADVRQQLGARRA